VLTHTLGKPKKPSLYSNKTDWNCFRETLDEQLTLTVPLKTEIDIEEAVENITKAIPNAVWQATPDSNDQSYAEEPPIIIKWKLAEKRNGRKRWQLTRAPQDKQRYNKITKELKHLLQTLKNEGIQTYLQKLTPTEATDYSLWKATRKIKQPQHQIPPIRIKRNKWARTDKQKATAYAKHLASVFQPFPSQLSAMEEETITNELNAPHQMALPMKKIRINEVKNVIKCEIHPKKAPG